MGSDGKVQTVGSDGKVQTVGLDGKVQTLDQGYSVYDYSSISMYEDA